VGTSFEELLSRRKPRESTVDVSLDADLLSQIEELERLLPVQRHLDETHNRTPEAPQTEAELRRLTLAAQQSAETFRFRELPRPVYRALIDAHPDPGGVLRWDEETFAPALLAATCVSHDFTEAEWKQLWNEWSAGTLYPMFSVAFEVCQQPDRVPFGVRSSTETQDSGQSSATAFHEE
jgi:hypothetical protein